MSSSNDIIKAYNRIKHLIINTPLVFSEILSQELGHEIYFKLDNKQVTGAFKIRGVLNHLLELKEQNKLPQKIVTYSTGNHAIALGYAAKMLNIKAKIFIPKYASKLKISLAKNYNSDIIITESRNQAEKLTHYYKDNGYYFLHPSASQSTIIGASTLCFESMQKINKIPDAIFASLGGGGLVSGSYLAKNLYNSNIKLFASEPYNASDGYKSIKQGSIFTYKKSPNTIADGLKALSLSEQTFKYLNKIDGIMTIKEQEIIYWTQRLSKLLKSTIEPSAAINLEAAKIWAQNQKTPKTILILISGGNY